MGGGGVVTRLSTLNHSQGKERVLWRYQEVRSGAKKGTNAGKRSNPLLPALYRKTQKTKCTFLFVTF